MKAKEEEELDDEGEDLERLADAVEEIAMANYDMPRFKGESGYALFTKTISYKG